MAGALRLQAAPARRCLWLPLRHGTLSVEELKGEQLGGSAAEEGVQRQDSGLA